ncbi:hypothetical protein BGZ70_010578, partial [Mortierella alpina]
SFEILGELLDELILDVAVEAHRDVKNIRSNCPICKTKCRSYVVRPGVDIFGQNPQPNNSQMIGTGERAGSGSPFTPLSYSDDREASDSDKDLLEKKRKKNTSTSGSNGNAANGSNGGDYGTPSSTKSSSSGGTKVKKQKQTDSSDYPVKTQKSSLLAKASKASASSSVKLKGLGLHTPSVPTPGAQVPVGEISLGYLDDNLLLANGRSLQNGSGGGTSNNSSSNSSTPQKLSSSNPKKSSGVSSSKRPPGSSSSSKNGQVLSFHDTLRAIGSRDGEHSDGSSSNAADSGGDDDDAAAADDEKVNERKGGGLVHSSSQPVHRVVLRLKKASAFSGHASDSLDTDFIDIDGDGDDDAMEILQTPKKKKS